MTDRILVLDDDTAIRESLLLFLEDYELDSVSASDAEEAFEALSQFACDIAIVDLRLPGKSGEEFIFEAHQLYPGMRYIVHTGSADYRLSQELQTMGVRDKDVHGKPVSDLNQILANVIELREMIAQQG